MSVLQLGPLPVPLQTAGRILLDSSNLSSITSSENAVSSIRDLSGAGNNGTQATGVNQPSTGILSYNGLNVMGFDGTNSRMDIAAAAAMDVPFTLFIVAKTNTTAGVDYLIARDGGGAPIGSYYFIIQSGGILQFQYRNGDGAPDTLNETTSVGTAPFIACIQAANGSQCRLILNNGTPIVGTPNLYGQVTAGTIGIGYRRSAPATTSNYLDGWIGDLDLSPAYLTDAEILQRFRHYSNKWGIAIS